MEPLRIELTVHPPSANDIWKGRRGGGKRLSDNAKSFRALFRRQAVKQLRVEDFATIKQHAEGDGVFLLTILVVLKSLKTKTTGRYKRLDISNRIKFVEDCFAKAIGADDSFNQGVQAWKVEHEDAPRTILICTMLEEPLGLDTLQ